MFFNSKQTDTADTLRALKARIEDVERDLAAEKTANGRNLLEYAELGEKMRRLYLRIARRAKIELEESSASNGGEEPKSAEETPLQIRLGIEKAMQL